MLAGKRIIYEYKKGELYAVETIESEYCSYFEHISSYVDLSMIKAANISQSFVFYWFDGIYFTDPSEAEKIGRSISEAGLNFKFETLTNFELLRNKGYINISYLKEGKPKIFNIPDKHILNTLNQLNKK
jgi:hypothetical protein